MLTRLATKTKRAPLRVALFVFHNSHYNTLQLRSLQSLGNVFNNIVNILDSHGKTDKVRGDPGCYLFLLGKLLVSG